MPTILRFLAVLVLLLALPTLRATAESHDTESTDAPAEEPKPLAEDFEDDNRRGEVYGSGDYRISRPGARPPNNFYAVRGFRPVDPGCYSGVLTWQLEAQIPTGGGAKFYADERINLRPARAGQRFAHRHRWTVSSDPIALAGHTTTSSGGGSGEARVQLWVSLDWSLYRVVTDVRPRAGNYQISTVGPMGRTVTEDFHFGFGDHHYSYVDLSQLEAAAGHPEVAQALRDIRAMLTARPPNVFMGGFDWYYEDDGTARRELLIEHEDRLAFGWGIKGEGRRGISITIRCDNILSGYERIYGFD
ncbi:hypothetical protein [Marimonas arenosa]|uniref:Uncharacterized protein n=1 Tax=Marimonas arenosa TaxID=1795305 RepID=A0AAE3WF02_9RHOB|nr:hypothetical protein [Marimonas arenosa]MDQ2091298.1 hypothetical protein [Marimonas arenosa]